MINAFPVVKLSSLEYIIGSIMLQDSYPFQSLFCADFQNLFNMFPVVCDQLTLLADHCAQCGIHASTCPSRQT